MYESQAVEKGRECLFRIGEFGEGRENYSEVCKAAFNAQTFGSDGAICSMELEVQMDTGQRGHIGMAWISRELKIKFIWMALL